MWQAPNHRVRALAAAKKREREKKRGRMHMKRVVAELRIPADTLGEQSHTLKARVMLNDLSPMGVGAFSPEALYPDQEVQLTIDQPRKFFIRGRVIWCQEYGRETPIISQNPFSYRVGIEFIFTSPEEQEEVKRFCEELAKNQLYTPPKAA